MSKRARWGIWCQRQTFVNGHEHCAPSAGKWMSEYGTWANDKYTEGKRTTFGSQREAEHFLASTYANPGNDWVYAVRRIGS